VLLPFSRIIPIIWDINLMVKGQRPVSRMPARSISLPRCTSGSFPWGRNWLTVVPDRRTKSEFVSEGPPPMKNPYDILRIKEQELMRVRKEMDALRIAARLLDAQDPGAAKGEDQPKLQRVVQMP